MKVTKTDAMRVLGLAKAEPKRVCGYLQPGYTDVELLRILCLEAEANGPQSFRDLFRHHAPSPRGRDEDMDMRHALVRLVEAGWIAYEEKIGVGRPTVKWFPTDAGKNALTCPHRKP